MAAAPIDLSAGLVPKPVDISAGLVPKDDTPDTRNAIQKSFDTNTQINPNDTLLQKGLKSVVHGAGVGFVHPLDTLSNLIPTDFATQYQQAQQQPKQSLASGVVTGLGEGFGGLASAAALGAGVKAAAPIVAPAVGGAMESAGENLQNRAVKSANRTVGSLEGDFDRGANPGRGYINNGLGVSSSMDSIAQKAAAKLQQVGQQLGQVYQKATDAGKIIPVDEVRQALQAPLDNAYDLETGIGGTGNTAVLDSYSAGVKAALDQAEAKGGFTPKELFDIKERISNQTNWGDAAQKSLNGVRQQQTGAISGILADNLPETRGLNQAYQDLSNLADRAQARANTGSKPLTRTAAELAAKGAGAAVGFHVGGPAGAVAGAEVGGSVGSVPVRTAIATGTNRLGQGLVTAGQKLGASPNVAGGVGVGIGTPTENVPNGVQQIGNAQAENSSLDQPQSAPPVASNTTTLKGSALWQELGSAKLQDHIARTPNSEISPQDVQALSSTPQGKSLLIKASDLSPGSPAMKSLTKEIQAVLGRTQ